MDSVFVSPQAPQIKIRIPVSVSVGSFVILPSPHPCPVAGTVWDCFKISLHTEQVCFSVNPSSVQVGSFALTVRMTWPEALMDFVSFSPQEQVLSCEPSSVQVAVLVTVHSPKTCS